MSANVTLPSYSVGEDCYEEIPYFSRRLGKKAVVIGGKTALSKTKDLIEDALKDSDMEILDFIWYGGDCTYENGEALLQLDAVRDADIIFGVGGGRAIDLCKYVAHQLDKPLFTFPTVGSNCAAVTAISVIYNEDGSFKEYYYPNIADHTFINTAVIADSPYELMWAGIGDALSKEAEAVFSSREASLSHTPGMGIALSHCCTDPLIEYGKAALEQCKNKTAGPELEQVVLDIIVSTGCVSNMVTRMPEYYYNSSLAHAIYNASTITKNGHNHLHGEVVSLGVLCLEYFDHQEEKLKKLMDFNASIGLPVCFEDIEITPDEFDAMTQKATETTEWSFKPDTVNTENFKEMLVGLDQLGKEYKAQRAIL